MADHHTTAPIDIASLSSDEFASTLPLHGAADPGIDPTTTTPGSFALAPDIGGRLMFTSPDTPGMPGPSDKTAWDFLPDGWSVETLPSPPGRGAGGEGGSVTLDKAAQHQPPDDAKKPSPQTPLPEGEGFTFTDARGNTRRVIHPTGFTPITQLEHARLGTITPQMKRVAERESHLTAQQVRDEVAAGRMIIPANINHLKYKLDPMCIGRASLTKVNANMGASPVSSGTAEEVEKLQWAERWGGDTVMDLSTGGDLDECRQAILENSTVPIGTVPIYSMIIGRRLEDLDRDIILSTIEHQARQGVDYLTIHAGVRRAHLKFVKNRLIGIVSRGGALLAKWMLHHGRENIMYELWDEICDIMRQHDVSFSIGDGLRPGGLADATDQAQLAELQTIAELTERAWARGVQVMVEGPGHVPFDQIEYNAKLQRRLCHGAPFYVLGPLVTDIFPGYDHITSAIGATSIAYHGAAMLCYVTPKEHLGLPKKDDVKQGCIAYKIAAHAADVALGIPGARERDDELTKARAALNWEKHFELSFDPDTARAYHDEDLDVDTDFCAMCGHDWCSVRISKEIQEFVSGKAPEMDAGKAKRSGALTDEQQRILEQRGHLSPEEIHKLAAKTKQAMGGGEGTEASGHRGTEVDGAGGSLPSPPGRGAGGEGSAVSRESVETKLSCHSDYVDPDAAKQMHDEHDLPLPRGEGRGEGSSSKDKLVELNTAPAHNLPTHDSVI